MSGVQSARLCVCVYCAYENRCGWLCVFVRLSCFITHVLLTTGQIVILVLELDWLKSLLLLGSVRTFEKVVVVFFIPVRD